MDEHRRRSAPLIARVIAGHIGPLVARLSAALPAAAALIAASGAREVAEGAHGGEDAT